MLKYIHVYSDNIYCESDSFKGTPNTIVMTEEDYKQLGKTLEFRNGQLAVMAEEEKNMQITALNAPKSMIE